jgi:hypothetical protein
MKLIISASFAVLLFHNSLAQVNGPSPVNLNEQYTYSFNDGVVYLQQNWIITGGTLISKYLSSGIYYAEVQWTSAGTGIVEFRDQNYNLRGSKSVTVQVPVPNTTYSNTQNCGSTIVTRSGSPPAATTWYWQTSSTGTSTTLGSGASITRTSTGTVYLRALNGTTWSPTSQSVGTVAIVSSTTVPASSTDGNLISYATSSVPVSVAVVPGATSYRWYNSSSTLIASATTNSYSPSVPPNTSQSFSAEAVTGNCASTTRRSVIATVHPEPVITLTNNIESATPFTATVLNYTYSTYQWLDKNGTAILGETSSSYTMGAGNYTIRVTKANSPPFDLPVYIGGNNKIVSTDVLVELVTSEQAIDILPVGSKSIVSQFFDGLGRPLQTVSWKNSSSLQDLVVPIEYDLLGREVRKYLPFTGGSNGWFKPNALKDPSNLSTDKQVLYQSGAQYQFYQGTNYVAADGSPFTETAFSQDPLSRPVKQGAPGADWQPDAVNDYISADHTIKNGYETNTSGDAVKAWTYTAPTASTSLYLAPAGLYPVSQLHKGKTKDEQGNQIFEFKNKEGKTYLKKVQAPNGEWAETYYIYNKAGDLVLVLPPEAVKELLK